MATFDNSAERANNLSFKKLAGYQYTAVKKAPFEEQGAPQLKLHSDNVWITAIPTDPIAAIAEYNNIDLSSFSRDDQKKAHLESVLDADAWTDGFSIHRKDYRLIVNTTVAGNLTWLIGRFNSDTGLYELGETIDNKFVLTMGYVGTQYSGKYAASLIYNGVEKGVKDFGDWNFDYDTGILTFLTLPSGINANSQLILRCYKYIGQVASESVGEPYDEVLGNFIIEPNVYYANKVDSGYINDSQRSNPKYHTVSHMTTNSTKIEQELAPKSVAIISSKSTYNEPTANLVFNGGDTISTSTTIIGRSITVEDMDVNSASVSFDSTGDISISNYESMGNYPKSSGNAQVKINTNEVVNISDCTFGQTGYNCVEIGLNGTSPKEVNITNCTFNNLTNNAILVFSHAEDAVITISNCTFSIGGNVLRISNRDNVKGTFRLVNCTFNAWEMDAEAGPIICQDYTNLDDASNQSANLFAPEKIKVEFVNCTDPNGNKLNTTVNPSLADPTTYCGTQDPATQLVHLFWKGTLPAYDAARWPLVTFE